MDPDHVNIQPGLGSVSHGTYRPSIDHRDLCREIVFVTGKGRSNQPPNL